MVLSDIKINIQNEKPKMKPREMAVTKSDNNYNNEIYTYTYTPMNKVKTLQQKQSTVD